jgi:hypothetical protein
MRQAMQCHIYRRPAGYIEEVLCGESFTVLEPLNPSKYLIPHCLHGFSRPID